MLLILKHSCKHELKHLYTIKNYIYSPTIQSGHDLVVSSGLKIVFLLSESKQKKINIIKSLHLLYGKMQTTYIYPYLEIVQILFSSSKKEQRIITH